MQKIDSQAQQEKTDRIQTLYSKAMSQIDAAIDYLEDNHASTRQQMRHVKNEFIRMMPDELLSIDIDQLMSKSEQTYLLANPNALQDLYLNKYKKTLDEENWVDDENPRTPPKRVYQEKCNKQKQIPPRKNPPMNIPSALKKELVSQQKQALKKGFTSSSKQAKFRFKE